MRSQSKTFIVLSGNCTDAEAWQMLVKANPPADTVTKGLVSFGITAGVTPKDLYSNMETLVAFTMSMCANNVVRKSCVRKLALIARHLNRLAKSIFKMYKVSTMGLFVLARMHELCEQSFVERIGKDGKESTLSKEPCCLFGSSGLSQVDTYADGSKSQPYDRTVLETVLNKGLNDIARLRKEKPYRKTMARIDQMLKIRYLPFTKRMKVLRRIDAEFEGTGEND